MKRVMGLIMLVVIICMPIYAKSDLEFVNIGTEYSKPTAFILDRSDFENSKLYVSTVGGSLLSSIDQGTNWDKNQLGESELISIKKRESYWITALNKNNGALLLTSTEGSSWTFEEFAVGIRNIYNDNQKFYMVTLDNRLYSSPTGETGTWKYETQNDDLEKLQRIHYSLEASKYFLLIDNKLYTTTSLNNRPTLVTYNDNALMEDTICDFIIQKNTIYLLSETRGIITATVSLGNISYVKNETLESDNQNIIYKALVMQGSSVLALTQTGDIVNANQENVYQTNKDCTSLVYQVEMDDKYLYILLENEGLICYDLNKEKWKQSIRADGALRAFTIQNDETTLISNESIYGNNLLFKVNNQFEREIVSKGYGYQTQVFKRGNEYVIRDQYNRESVSTDLKAWKVNENKMIAIKPTHSNTKLEYYKLPNQIYFKDMIFSYQIDKPSNVLTFIHDEELPSLVEVIREEGYSDHTNKLNLSKTHDGVTHIGKLYLDEGKILSVTVFHDKLMIGTDTGNLLVVDVRQSKMMNTVAIESVYVFDNLKNVKNVKVINNEIVIVDGLTLYRSKDAQTWETSVIPTKYFADEQINEIAYGNELYVAIGSEGQIASSKDLISWTKVSSPRSVDLSSIIFDGEKFIVCGKDGSLLVSKN